MRRLNFQFIWMKVTTSVGVCWYFRFGVRCACACGCGCVCALCTSPYGSNYVEIEDLFTCAVKSADSFHLTAFYPKLQRTWNAAYPMRQIPNACQRTPMRFSQNKNDLFTFGVWRFTCQLTVCSAQFCKCQIEYMSRFV